MKIVDIFKQIRLSKQLISFLIAIIITGTLIVLTLIEIQIPFIRTLEAKSIDLRFKIRGVEKVSGDIVIAAIDERSIEAIGRWPWPRLPLAKLIQVLNDAGVSSIGIDLLFIEPEEKPELNVIHQLIIEFNRLKLLDLSPESQEFFERLTQAAESLDNDAIFAEIIRESGKVTLGTAFIESVLNSEPQKADRKLPIPVLANAAKHLGFVNVKPDDDRHIRKAFITLKRGMHYYTSLPVRVVQRHLNLEDSAVSLLPGKDLQMGSLKIPLDAEGRTPINFYGPIYTFPYYSIIDIITGSVPPETFNGKAVMIGGSALGLGDHFPNPFKDNFWGVELQATIAENILKQQFLTRPAWVKLIDSAILSVFGIILAGLLPRIRSRWFIPCCLFLILLSAGTNQYVFQARRIIMGYVYPILEIGMVGIAIFIYRYQTEGRERRVLKNAFQFYLHPSVVNRIIEHPEDFKLGGKKAELTVMFSDIRDFTKLSEEMSPEEVVKFVNRYLTLMSDIILKNEGTLDKFIGDAIMTIFGAPETQPDHVVRACRTAIEMSEALHYTRQKWFAEGLPMIRIGTGINTGEVIVGNMGSEKRFQYTVMGDHVNLASRLEGLSKVYGVKILVSEGVYETAKNHFKFRELDLVKVKGRDQSVRIFELFGEDYYTNGMYKYIEVFQEGLQAYRAQQWDIAIRCFEEVLRLKTDDRPTLIFLERCQKLKLSEPMENWDGTYSAVTK